MRKNTNTVAGFVLTAVICFLSMALASCGSDSPSAARVMMLGKPDGDIFPDSLQIIDVSGEEYQNENANAVKTMNNIY